MNFEKSEGANTHTIESEQVLVCSETGRVVAVFYNDYDLDEVLVRLKASSMELTGEEIAGS